MNKVTVISILLLIGGRLPFTARAQSEPKKADTNPLGTNPHGTTFQGGVRF